MDAAGPFPLVEYVGYLHDSGPARQVPLDDHAAQGGAYSLEGGVYQVQLAGFVVGEDHEDVAAKLVRHQARSLGRLGLANTPCVQMDIDDMCVFQRSDLVSSGRQINFCGSVFQAHDARRLLKVQLLSKEQTNLAYSVFL